VPGAADPYRVLGVPRGADAAQIHAAYRAAVRRTHPDAGGSATAFEAVHEAYEALRDPAELHGDSARQTRDPEPVGPDPARQPRVSSRRIDDLIAESHRLEDEARRLAGMAPRYRDPDTELDESTDSVAAILRDAAQQARAVADDGARGLRRIIRRRL
jgi:curved DNA-binding protein CbpA